MSQRGVDALTRRKIPAPAKIQTPLIWCSLLIFYQMLSWPVGYVEILHLFALSLFHYNGIPSSYYIINTDAYVKVLYTKLHCVSC